MVILSAQVQVKLISATRAYDYEEQESHGMERWYR